MELAIKPSIRTDALWLQAGVNPYRNPPFYLPVLAYLEPGVKMPFGPVADRNRPTKFHAPVVPCTGMRAVMNLLGADSEYVHAWTRTDGAPDSKNRSS